MRVEIIYKFHQKNGELSVKGDNSQNNYCAYIFVHLRLCMCEVHVCLHCFAYKYISFIFQVYAHKYILQYIFFIVFETYWSFRNYIFIFKNVELKITALNHQQVKQTDAFKHNRKIYLLISNTNETYFCRKKSNAVLNYFIQIRFSKRGKYNVHIYIKKNSNAFRIINELRIIKCSPTFFKGIMKLLRVV